MISSAKTTFALLSDGSSDKVIINILEWLIKQYILDASVSVEFVDLRRLLNPPKSLEDRMQAALDYYNCDILFVHRMQRSRL